jgi:hypothetical protein
LIEQGKESQPEFIISFMLKSGLTNSKKENQKLQKVFFKAKDLKERD